MLSTDWEFVDKLVAALEVLKLVTLEFSKKSFPTISKVLPLYKLMEVTLTNLAEKYEDNEPNLSVALLAGAAIATNYISKALFSDYPLLGAGKFCILLSGFSFFKSSQWDLSVAVCAKMLLVTIVKKYAKADRHPAPSNVETVH
ncbi:hypothetical protein B0H14DRAFT_3493573 [Mycena olivaceomarginata]|nr:hypothetical protein B0H14DRAFT_3493573 [Mycena olivaceomarginata]